MLEGVTAKGLRSGVIQNDIRERLIATETPLVTSLRMPAATLPFLYENYLPIAFRLMVLGKWLGEATPEVRPAKLEFDLVVPGRYAVIAEQGDVTGALNGVPLQAAQFLPAGHYTLDATGGSGRVALI